MKHTPYHIYIRNDWPLPFVQPWGHGPTALAKPPFQWHYILVANLGDRYAWCYRSREIFKLGKTIDAHLANPKNLRQFKRQATLAEHRNRKFVQSIEKINASKLSLAELGLLLRQWYAVHSRFTAAFMPIDATDETLEEDIRSALSNTELQVSNEEFTALFTPNAPTYVQREHKEFCALAAKFQNKLDRPAARRSMRTHAAKWWWTVMGWGQPVPLNEKSVIANIKKIKSISVLLAKQREEEKQLRQTLLSKRSLFKKLPRQVKNLLNAFEVLAEMHDTRKEMQMRSMAAGFVLTNELLARNGIPGKFRNFILIEEYLELARGNKPSLQELNNRSQFYWCEFTTGGKIRMIFGAKAKIKLQKTGIGQPHAEAGGVIRGVCANPGFAKGRARVELKASIMNKILKPGEILVTSQTTPEFAPAMKKAAAIVTDEGGITSHAAIVSRELKKPCIIGTKTATHILKTGDMVAVDANKGIIKKLS